MKRITRSLYQYYYPTEIEQQADLIVVIDKGEIAESGSHQELMSKGGLYKRLIDMQTFND